MLRLLKIYQETEPVSDLEEYNPRGLGPIVFFSSFLNFDLVFIIIIRNLFNFFFIVLSVIGSVKLTAG
jgi:hypothetical protein